MNGSRKFSKNGLKFAALVCALLLVSSLGYYVGYVSSSPVSPTIYLDDLPSQAQYTIKTDGTNYWSVRYDGYKAYESTTFYTVITSTLTAMGSPPTGLLHLAKGTFDITNYEIIISGAGTLAPPHQLIIEGEGRDTIITQNGLNKRIFAFQNGLSIILRNMELDMRDVADTSSASAIDCNANGASKTSIYNSAIYDVRVFGGDTTHPLVDLENIFYSDFDNLIIYAVYGNGLRLYNNMSGNNFGNSHFGYVSVAAAASSGGTAVEITGNLAYASTIGLLSFDHLELSNYPQTNGNGLWIHGRANDIQIGFLNLETQASSGSNSYALRVDGDGGTSTTTVTISQFTGGVPAGGYLVFFNKTQNNRILNGYTWWSGTPHGMVITDTYNSGRPNFISMSVPNLAEAVFNIGSANKPRLELSDATYPELMTPNSGSQSVADGDTITHRVGQTPTYYTIAGTIADEMVSISSVNSTMLTVSIKRSGALGFFWDLFDSGDLSKWSGNSTGSGGTIELDDADPFSGIYSLKASLPITGGSYAYAHVTFPNQMIVYSRAYIKFSALPTLDNQYTWFITQRDFGVADAMSAGIVQDGGVDKWCMRARDGAITFTENSTTLPPAINTWNVIETETVVSSSGSYRMWINGTLVIEATDKDVSGAVTHISDVCFGASHYYPNTSFAVDVFIDDVVIGSTYIGTGDTWKIPVTTSGTPQTVYWYAAYYP